MNITQEMYLKRITKPQNAFTGEIKSRLFTYAIVDDNGFILKDEKAVMLVNFKLKDDDKHEESMEVTQNEKGIYEILIPDKVLSQTGSIVMGFKLLLEDMSREFTAESFTVKNSRFTSPVSEMAAILSASDIIEILDKKADTEWVKKENKNLTDKVTEEMTEILDKKADTEWVETQNKELTDKIAETIKNLKPKNPADDHPNPYVITLTDALRGYPDEEPEEVLFNLEQFLCSSWCMKGSTRFSDWAPYIGFANNRMQLTNNTTGAFTPVNFENVKNINMETMLRQLVVRNSTIEDFNNASTTPHSYHFPLQSLPDFDLRGFLLKVLIVDLKGYSDPNFKIPPLKAP